MSVNPSNTINSDSEHRLTSLFFVKRTLVKGILYYIMSYHTARARMKGPAVTRCVFYSVHVAYSLRFPRNSLLPLYKHLSFLFHNGVTHFNEAQTVAPPELLACTSLRKPCESSPHGLSRALCLFLRPRGRAKERYLLPQILS